MYETREVTITLRLPPDIADQAEEIQKEDPEFLSRVVLYGLTRLQIYRSIQERERQQDPIITVDVTPGGVVRTRYDFVPPIDPMIQ